MHVHNTYSAKTSCQNSVWSCGLHIFPEEQYISEVAGSLFFSPWEVTLQKSPFVPILLGSITERVTGSVVQQLWRERFPLIVPMKGKKWGKNYINLHFYPRFQESHLGN